MKDDDNVRLLFGEAKYAAYQAFVEAFDALAEQFGPVDIHNAMLAHLGALLGSYHPEPDEGLEQVVQAIKAAMDLKLGRLEKAP